MYYCKYQDLAHTLNVNKVAAKEHQVGHSWAAGERLVSKTLFSKH